MRMAGGRFEGAALRDLVTDVRAGCVFRFAAVDGCGEEAGHSWPSSPPLRVGCLVLRWLVRGLGFPWATLVSVLLAEVRFWAVLSDFAAAGFALAGFAAACLAFCAQPVQGASQSR